MVGFKDGTYIWEVSCIFDANHGESGGLVDAVEFLRRRVEDEHVVVGAVSRNDDRRFTLAEVVAGNVVRGPVRGPDDGLFGRVGGGDEESDEDIA